MTARMALRGAAVDFFRDPLAIVTAKIILAVMMKAMKTGRDRWAMGGVIIQRRYNRSTRTTPARRSVTGEKTVERFCRVKYDVFVDGRQVSPIGGLDSFKAAESFAAQVSS